MKLYVDLETLQLIEGPGFRNPVTAISFKRGDAARLDVSFLESGTSAVAIGDPTALEIRFGIKPRNRFNDGYLVHDAVWTMPDVDAESQVYQCSPSFNTEELNSVLGVGSSTGTEPSEITLMGEITWREGTGQPTSTRTFLVVVENDVNRGTEGVPALAEPPYPAPQNILIALPQSLTSGQKTQVRQNIGAIGQIANGSLSIAKTSGLQSALNGKAPMDHTHEIGSVNGLQIALDGKIGFKLQVAPYELIGYDAGLPWILKKNGTIWIYDPSSGATILANDSPPPPPPSGSELQAYFVTNTDGTSESTSSIEIPAGSYLVTISAAYFTTSSWGSHNLSIPYDDANASFSNPSPGSLYGMQVTTGPGNLYFYLADPSNSPNPQIGTVNLQVTTATLFHIEGYLPTAGDFVYFTITFTQI